jgi:hypothetical protein
MRSFIFVVTAIWLLACGKAKETGAVSDTTDSLTFEVADSVAVDFLALESYLHRDPVDTAAVETYDQTCAVLVYPTDDQIEEMKKEYGDDFYTVADDGQFYQAAAIEKLDSAGITQFVSNVKRYARFKGAGREWLLDVRKRDFPEWNIILFSKEKAPKIVYSIDLTTDSIKTYFTR